MKTDFKYESKWDKKTLRHKINIWYSKQLFILYQNKFFKKLNLDTNELIKNKIKYGFFGDEFLVNNLPENHSLIPLSFSFFDIIPIEDSNRFKQKFISLISVFKRNPFTRDLKDIPKVFSKFENSYKSTSWGDFCTIDLIENKELDLIDQINFRYVKGPQSTFIIEYNIKPSLKFNNLYKKLISQNSNEYKVIRFNSIKNILISKQIINSIHTYPVYSNYHLNRLVQDLNHQVKFNIGSKLAFGLFQKNKNYLLPCILVVEISKTEFLKFDGEFHEALGIYKPYNFITDQNNLIFNLPPVQLSTRSFEKLTLIFLKDEDQTKEKTPEDELRSTKYLSNYYKQVVSPLWSSLNYAAVNQTFIINQRRKIFQYFNKNKDSLFLKKMIKLKYQILQNWLIMSRIIKDYESPIFKNYLDSYEVLGATDQSFDNNSFKERIWNYTQSTLKDVVNEYSDIKSLFEQVSEDNITRSNMKIQKILFWITIIGVLIAVYSTNTDYFNSWIEYYLKTYFNIQIPRAKSTSFNSPF